MPRKKLVRSDWLPYHVVSRANNREPFQAPLEKVWDVFSSELYRLRIVYEAEIHAFVLMPNHYHLLITVPKFDLGKIMKELNQSVTQTLNLKTGRLGHVFGGPYHQTLIADGLYYLNAFKYVYRNPAKAKLCARVEDYSLSSLSGLMGSTALPFPIHWPQCGHGSRLAGLRTEELLGWLNTSHRPEQDDAIRRALRRREFKVPLNRSTRRPIDLEIELP